MDNRKQPAEPMTLTEATRMVLRHAHAPSPFAAFVIDRRLVLCHANTARCEELQRQAPDAMIGTYGRGMRVTDLLEDLREYFSDDPPAAAAR